MTARIAHGLNALAGANIAAWQCALAALLWLLNRLFVTAPLWSPVATAGLVVWAVWR